MHIIKIKDEELILVERPMGETTFYMHDLLLWGKDVPFPDIKSVEILGTITNGVPDFDVEPYVERELKIDPYSSLNMVSFLNLPSDEFRSLLESHSIPYKSTKLICLKARK